MSTHNMISSRNKKKKYLANPLIQGPVVQSVVSLTGLLVVKMLTVLVSTISNSQVFLNAKATHILSAKILVHMPYLMIKVLIIR